MKAKLWGATLLVAGVAIGAGMLGMPIATGFAGFYPSLLAMVVSWAFLLLTGFVMIDLTLNVNKPGGGVISMAEQTWGRWGKITSWLIYLFLLYALDIAFLAAGQNVISNLCPDLPSMLIPLMIVLPLGLIIAKGMRAVDGMNRLLVVAKLVCGYGLLVWLIPPHVSASLLSHAQLAVVPLALPVIVQAFGFHSVIPSLVHYLERDVKSIRLALTCGSLIALIVYSVWEMLVLGVVPVTGSISITTAFTAGQVSTVPLMHLLQAPLIATGATLFALLSVGTAFLGVTLSLFDTIKDGLGMEENNNRSWIAYLLTFLPPLFFIYVNKGLFLTALSYAGALVALIFGIIPLMMIRKSQAPSFWTTTQGKILMCTGVVFFSVTIGMDILTKLGLV